MTLELIPTKNRRTSAKDLLFFLGCLPGGISMQNLEKMWTQNLKDELKELQELSLIEDSQEEGYYYLSEQILEFT